MYYPTYSFTYNSNWFLLFIAQFACKGIRANFPSFFHFVIIFVCISSYKLRDLATYPWNEEISLAGRVGIWRINAAKLVRKRSWVANSYPTLQVLFPQFRSMIGPQFELKPTFMHSIKMMFPITTRMIITWCRTFSQMEIFSVLRTIFLSMALKQCPLCTAMIFFDW